jgi:hypothetical protein
MKTACLAWTDSDEARGTAEHTHNWASEGRHGDTDRASGRPMVSTCVRQSEWMDVEEEEHRADHFST